jgi:hypothetical protein
MAGLVAGLLPPVAFLLPGFLVRGIVAGVAEAIVLCFEPMVAAEAATNVGAGGDAIPAAFSLALGGPEPVGGCGILVVEVVGALAGARAFCGLLPCPALRGAAELLSLPLDFTMAARR